MLQTQMKTVQGDISEIKGDMKDIKTLLLTNATNAVPRDEFDKKIKELERAGNLKTVGWALVAAIVTAMAYALIVGRHA